MPFSTLPAENLQVMRPLRLHKWFAALCLLDCAVAAEASPPVLTLGVTYYDFRVHEDIHNNPVTHPDFERSCHPGPRSFDPCVGEKGLVEEKLGWDGRPVCIPGVSRFMPSCTTFNQWFNDAPGVNRVIDGQSITLTGVEPLRERPSS